MFDLKMNGLLRISQPVRLKVNGMGRKFNCPNLDQVI
jgi:hypothetical protein